MEFIDERFKEVKPQETVERIQSILARLGVALSQSSIETGIENCHSVHVALPGGFPYANGKGVTFDFSRASAHAEFMERLQSGLFFYKYQCLEDDPELNMQSYAPDKVYMSEAELIQNGEWMDHLIDEYGSNLTREKLAKQCLMYANSDKALCVPFYSFFENKYIYLPAGFIEHIYSANGCCAGNSRDEAWVHAISEIYERRCTLKYMMSGCAAPEIPLATISEFKTVCKIIQKIEASGKYKVTILDFSSGKGIYVVASRIINLETQDYIVDIGADPVLEIAIERSLTEIFQGRNVNTLKSGASKHFLASVNELPNAHNILNQLETANGSFTVDFFTDFANPECRQRSYDDNSCFTNTELVKMLLLKLKEEKRPLYIRNYSFLGFPCYKLIVPGFSESRGVRLTQTVQEYALATVASKVLRNIEHATESELESLQLFQKLISGARSRAGSYSLLSGIPLATGKTDSYILYLHYSYAAFHLGQMNEAKKNLLYAASLTDSEKEKQYLNCFARYCELMHKGVKEEKILRLLSRLFYADVYSRFSKALESGNPYESRLVRCNPSKCFECAYSEQCNYQAAKDLISLAGNEYSKFFDGQNESTFSVTW